MGNGGSAGGLSDRLRTMIATEPQIWTEMYNRDPQRTRSVQMTSQEAVMVSHPDDVSFEIELIKSHPTGISVVALLPGSPRHILWTSSYSTLEAFNARLNAHITQSTLGETEAFIGFCYIDHVFIVPFANKMRLYLQWAKQIATYRAGDSQIWRTAGDVPLLISTDSHSKIRAIYPVIAGEGTHSTRYLNPERVKWVTKVGSEFVNLFSCETPRPSDDAPPVIIPLTVTEVVNHRERQVLPRNEIPVPQDRRSSQPIYRPADFSEEQEEDHVREFFSVEQKMHEAEDLRQNLIADISHFQQTRRLGLAPSSGSSSAGSNAPASTSNARLGNSNGSSDGEIMVATPPSSIRFTTPIKMDSPTRRTTIPVGLIPREEHRLGGNGKRPVGIKPRERMVSDPESSSEM